jgi:hypothetical protein
MQLACSNGDFPACETIAPVDCGQEGVPAGALCGRSMPYGRQGFFQIRFRLIQPNPQPLFPLANGLNLGRLMMDFERSDEGGQV